MEFEIVPVTGSKDARELFGAQGGVSRSLPHGMRSRAVEVEASRFGSPVTPLRSERNLPPGAEKSPRH